MNNEFSGIVMFSKEHKDVDAMVKVFTREYGKQMFFVKQLNAGTHHLKSVLVSGTRAKFVGTINVNGLSFLRDYKEKQSLWRQMDNIFIQAYVAYFIAMADAVIDDRIVHTDVFDLLWCCLDLIENDVDIESISLLFEVKMLRFWHVLLRFDECVITHHKNVPLDFSFKYGGCIANTQWHNDAYRLNIHPNAIFLLHQLQNSSLHQLSKISISSALKKEMQRCLDFIYDEYVGVKLKSKKYITDLKMWYEDTIE